ncbi:Uncharacterised protein [Sphingobacterium daejeonense]|nr:Uncharacterised protein [Sphingobacterium daejeonense]
MKNLFLMKNAILNQFISTRICELEMLLRFTFYFLIIGFSLLVSACNNQNKDFRYVQTIPDSLRTSEEKMVANQLIKVLIEDIKVENNKIVLKSSKSDFKSKGIPIQYFNKLTDDIDNTNKYMNSNNVNNIQELVDSLKSNLSRELKN